MWSDEKKLILNAYDTYEGYLGVPQPWNDATGKTHRHASISWNSCREDFHRNSVGLRFFYFAYCGSHAQYVADAQAKGRPQNVAAFMDKVEDRLGLNVRSVMGPTTKPQVMWIKRPLWWTCENMRRSLYTALLRAGLTYDPNKDNFDAAMKSRDYTSLTLPAVDRFLKGFTSYKGYRVGWQSAMWGLTDKELKTTLVLPARKRRYVES